MIKLYKNIINYLHAFIFYILILSIALMFSIGNFDTVDFGSFHLDENSTINSNTDKSKNISN